ncbi:Trans-Golgi network integral membrane protein 2 [Orchesella cincta]|uniref:Trans-Golgi network integral membrane protein 2 n=1 Tax=Orchesella cincta TaxID=48709 RepID=A0A1D2NLH0_ORCCI|nr:Trans-Golgi network integral membrane protein 2 [Orchesella cincta]
MAVVLFISKTDVNSAPTSVISEASKNVTFWDSLYNSTGQGCDFVPRVNTVYENTIRSKINTACNNTTSGDVRDLKKSSSSLSGVCTSLQSLFPVLCKSSLSKVPSLKINTSVDLKEINGLGVEKVCERLKDAVQSISKSQSLDDKSGADGMVLFLQTEGTNNDLECSKVCKNTPKDVVEDIELQAEASPVNTKPSLEPSLNIPNSDDSVKPAQLLKEETSSAISTPKIVEVSTLPSQVVNANDANQNVEDKNKPVGAVTEKSKDATPSKTVKVAVDPSAPTEKIESSKGSSPLASVSESVVVVAESDPYKEKLSPVSEIAVPSTNTLAEAHKEEIKSQQQQSSKTSSTTVASVDRGRNEFNDLPIPPIGNEKKTIKSSTAFPKEEMKTQNSEKKIDQTTGNGSPQLHVSSLDDNLPSPPVNEPKKTKVPIENPNSPKKTDDVDAGEEEQDDYKFEEDLDTGADKPPVSSKKEVDPEISNFDDDTSFKPSKSRFSNSFGNGLPYEGRGTTINVSLNETEDTGFFNYFLFCVTLVGLLYLVIHNKKKLIAYVVEGKRPRGRSTGRRSSTGSQYRRLENNFD